MNLGQVSLKETHYQAAPVASARWQRVQVFHSGDAFFTALEDSIESARSTIEIESYIFAWDRFGERVVKLLREARARGVVVRIIIDGIGSASWAHRLREEARDAGLQIKVFHELPWTRWLRGESWLAKQMTLWRALQRMNNRNHRKVCIVDRFKAFVGSMNIIEYHLERYVGSRAWRDTGVVVEGPEVAVLGDSFDELWSKRPKSLRSALRQHKAASSGTLVKLNVRRKQRQENYVDLLVRIVGAKERIWIESAYFVPDGSLVRALAVAAEAGVDVKILVPAVSDVFFIPWVTSAFHAALLRAGVRVFEYTRSMMHAKTILVDDWGLVGSSNLNHRSLFHDLEADIVLVDDVACRSLYDQFIIDCAAAREVTLSTWHDRPWLERFLGRTLLTMRKMM
jgi:cardiolipin synthase